MWLYFLVCAVMLFAVSGVPSACAGKAFSGGDKIAAAMSVAACALGLAAAFATLTLGTTVSFNLSGPVGGQALHFHLDPLSAFFLVPIFLIGALGSVYAAGYWRQEEHPRTVRKLQLCYGLHIAAMALVVLAADGIAFLMAWEVMALAAFFLISTEDYKTEVREAGWLYLVATHFATLSLFALFALLRTTCGSFEFHRLEPGQVGIGLRTAIFAAALAGFGLKAGMMPLHFWLPSAHAAAPSHVSAILSGVMLKVGIYGLMRTLTLLPVGPVGWGDAILVLGTISAVAGVLFALGQHDLKRLLAYHSIENIGIILIGLGLAMIGQARGRPEWVVLGIAGCLLHVWNHSLFKSLLFFAAGSAVHAARTREIDLMGGLSKALPKTAFLFFIGAAAICGLPPLNGFVSELFIYLGLFQTLHGLPGVALAAPALALAGSLALACFVKAFGAVFLGVPRSRSTDRTHESPPTMIVPMCVLGASCAFIGIFPFVVVRPLDAVIHQWTYGLARTPTLGAVVPFSAITQMALSLTALSLVVFLFNKKRLVLNPARKSVTWDCGYARPTARMQYTASSFASTLVYLFRGVLRPTSHEPRVSAVFPGSVEFSSHVDDAVLDGFLVPLWRRFRSRLSWLRVLQQGSVQTYILYILIALLFLLLMLLPLSGILREMLGGAGQ
jgi:hydrogenase-4 component B